jgi:hypothetical protein
MSRPFLLLFPLGALLGLYGVSHWILYARGVLSSYEGQGHALVQVQGFLLAFGSGFLFTMIPRHSASAPPTPALVRAVVLLLTAGAFAALRGAWWFSQGCSLFVLLLLAQFLLSRVGRRLLQPPYLLLSFGLSSGLLGGACILWALSASPPWLLPLSRSLVQEGMFLGFVLGLGQILHKAIMGDPTRQAPPRWLDPLAAALLVLSFLLQGILLAQDRVEFATRLSQFLRALAILVVLRFGIQAQRRPRLSGNHRTWVWLAFWLLPVGPLACVLLPSHRVALLHILFAGSFSILVFSIAHHAMHAHSGEAKRLLGTNKRVRVFGALLVFAMLTRVTADLWPDSYWMHIEAAAAIWLLALAIWLWAVAAALRAAWREEMLAATSRPN